MAELTIRKYRVADLSSDPANARKHSDRNIEAILGSLKRFGQQKPIVVDVSGVVRAGNGTLEAARRLGWVEIDGVETGLQGSEATAYAIADNQTAALAEWDDSILAATLESLQAESEELLKATGFDDAELAEMLRQLQAGDGDGRQEASSATLCERFLVPPFSVLDARQGYWQDRKRAWLALGIESELGRGGGHQQSEQDGAGVGGRIPEPSGTQSEVSDRQTDRQTDSRAIKDHEWQRRVLGKVQGPASARRKSKARNEAQERKDATRGR